MVLDKLNVFLHVEELNDLSLSLCTQTNAALSEFIDMVHDKPVIQPQQSVCPCLPAVRLPQVNGFSHARGDTEVRSPCLF